jgi:hypothetical protein
VSGIVHQIGAVPQPRHTMAARAERDVAVWARASVTLAQTVAYHEGHQAGSGDHQEGALLPAEDVTQGQALVPRQLVLAGDRLADVLTGTFTP